MQGGYQLHHERSSPIRVPGLVRGRRLLASLLLLLLAVILVLVAIGFSGTQAKSPTTTRSAVGLVGGLEPLQNHREGRAFPHGAFNREGASVIADDLVGEG